MLRAASLSPLCFIALLKVLACTPAAADDDAADAGRNVHRRSDFQNARIRFERQRAGRVAFLGGSITEMEGYRPLVMELLRQRFPETGFEFINAGIASTCSTTGAFRLDRDVFSAGTVDLLFVEFAVNDDQDAGHQRRECIRGMEGILRRALLSNPHIEIVVTHFVNPSMLESLQNGRIPLTMSAHKDVAERYGVSSIALASEIATRISDGTLTWEEYGGTHPAPRGNQICADMIALLLNDAWSDPLPPDADRNPREIPVEPIDELSYFQGRFVPRDDVQPGNHWRVETPDWPRVPGNCRDRFRELTLICSEEPGAELSVGFTGTAIGAYLLAGPDAGVLLATIDDGPVREMNLYHRFSRNLHYPRTVMFAADLAHGPHVLKLRISPDAVEPGAGRAVRIIDFVAN